MWVVLEIDEGNDRTTRVVGPFDSEDEAQVFACHPPSDPPLWSWQVRELEAPQDAADAGAF